MGGKFYGIDSIGNSRKTGEFYLADEDWVNDKWNHPTTGWKKWCDDTYEKKGCHHVGHHINCHPGWEDVVVVDGSHPFTAPICGVTPVSGCHLVTKAYVDTAIGVSGAIDHGELLGLDDDDHDQYILVDGTRAFTGVVGGITPTAVNHLATKGYVDNSVVDDHGALVGLGDDDHTQYHNDTRGDVRYYTKTQLDAGQLDNRYYTETELDAGQLDNRYYTESEVDSISGALSAEIDSDIATHSSDANAHHTKYTNEEAKDAVGNIMVGAGTVTVTYDDVGDTITVSGSDVPGAHTHVEDDITDLGDYSVVGHSHTESDITDLDKYTQAEITTISGDIVAQIITDHGALSGLGDDDHTQYSLADGTRAFTGVVGGVTPTADAHLTTKQYVDGAIATATGSLTTDHGSLLGLGDDDHPQYHNDTRGDARYYTKTQLDAGQLDNRYYTETEVDSISGSLQSNIDALTHDGFADFVVNEHVDHSSVSITGAGDLLTGQGGDITASRTFTLNNSDVDHGSISGIGDDDHTQYHNDTRGDARYYTKTQLDAGQLDNRYYTESEVDSISGSLQSNIDALTHDGFADFVANEHVDHSTVSITGAGDLLTGQGGDITSSRTITLNNSDIDHDQLTNTHNLTTDIDHDQLTNTHNLTTDIDHDQLTNYSADEHFTEASIDHGSISGLGDDDHTQYLLADGSRHAATLVIDGDLLVSGTKFISSTETVEIEDNLLIINEGEVGSGVTASGGEAGIEVDRGSLTNYRFIFDETQDNFRVGEAGDLQAVATREDTPVNGGVAFWNATENRFDTDSGLVVTGGALDHGALSGLGDNDHTQYLMTATYPLEVTGQDVAIKLESTDLGVDGDNELYVKDAGIDHDATTNFVADEHVDHSTVSINGAGDLLTGQGGDITATRTFTLNNSDIDHGSISGTGDDDHTQYHNDTRGDARYYTQTQLNNGQLDTRYYTEAEVDSISGSLQSNIDALTHDGFADFVANEHVDHSTVSITGAGDLLTGQGGDITATRTLTLNNSDIDHGSISGTGDDDHTQYHNDTRGDARYYTQTQLDAGQLDNRYYTEAEVDSISGALSAEIDSDIATHTANASAHHARYTNEEAQDAVGNIMSGAGTVTVTYDDAGNAITVSGSDVPGSHTHVEADITDLGNYSVVGHSHTESDITDLDKYTQAEVDSISGALDVAKSDVGHIHDDRYYTETELDAGQLDNRYYTETELDAGQLDNRYYTEAEVDSISGALSAEIDADITTHASDASAHHVKYTDEEAQDAVGNIMSGAGTVTVTYDDAGNAITVSGNAAIDHGGLTGLGDDDHPHYHNDTRGDARYYTQTQLDAGQLDNRYYTETEVDNAISTHTSDASAHHAKYTDEEAKDAVGNIMVGAGTVTVTYDDSGDTITVSGTDTEGGCTSVEVEDNDVDTGTQTVDSFSKDDAIASVWEYVIKKDTDLRTGRIMACWDGTNVEYSETSTNDLGDTSDISFSVAIIGSDVALRVTATSDNWAVFACRKLLGSGYVEPPTPIGNRGVFAGGGGPNTNTIDYIAISALGNAQDFGDLSIAADRNCGTSNGYNGDRGVITIGGSVNVLEYITISTPGNSSDFGDLSQTTQFKASTSNHSNNRGIIAGGNPYSNVIEYITISTPGNASSFGEMNEKRDRFTATSNGTNERGVFCGGFNGSTLNSIEYITISTPGNGTDFGDLTAAVNEASATSNLTNNRAVVAGGTTGSEVNVIDYFTITTLGNALDFGDLTTSRLAPGATSNGLGDRGVWAGGGRFTRVNIIDYVTISSTGNAADFGDLTVSRRGVGACSNA
jgi:hypothetical protein